MTTKLTAALLELRIRQAQMLNLEVRLFIILLVSQLLFYILSATSGSGLQKPSPFAEFGGVAAFTVLLLVGIGTNAKMGLAARYLTQLEEFLETSGGVGVIWERRVMGTWVFVPGNAFTLTAGLVACVLAGEFFWLWLRFLSLAVDGPAATGGVALIFTAVLVWLGAKAATVDFGRAPPEFFAVKPSASTEGSRSSQRPPG